MNYFPSCEIRLIKNARVHAQKTILHIISYQCKNIRVHFKEKAGHYLEYFLGNVYEIMPHPHTGDSE